jgi:hypothetical protein
VSFAVKYLKCLIELHRSKSMGSLQDCGLTVLKLSFPFASSSTGAPCDLLRHGLGLYGVSRTSRSAYLPVRQVWSVTTSACQEHLALTGPGMYTSSFFLDGVIVAGQCIPIVDAECSFRRSGTRFERQLAFPVRENKL